MQWDRSMQSFAPHFGSEHCRTHGDQLWRGKKQQQKNKTKIDIKISVMWKIHIGFYSAYTSLLTANNIILCVPKRLTLFRFLLCIYIIGNCKATYQTYDRLGFFFFFKIITQIKLLQFISMGRKPLKYFSNLFCNKTHQSSKV